MALVRDGAGRPNHLTAMVENIDGRKRAEAELVHRTIHDPLTRLPNRQHFLDRLAEARAGLSAHDLDVGVVFVDIDNFKHVNDSLGHEAGNELLVAVAAVSALPCVPPTSWPGSAATSSSCSPSGSATRRTRRSCVAPGALAARTFLGRWHGGQRHGQLRRRDLSGSRRSRRGARPQGRRRDVHGEATRKQPVAVFGEHEDAGTAPFC